MIVEVGVIVIAFTFTMCSIFFGIWLSIALQLILLHAPP
jgi:hypothetical protein